MQKDEIHNVFQNHTSLNQEIVARVKSADSRQKSRRSRDNPENKS